MRHKTMVGGSIFGCDGIHRNPTNAIKRQIQLRIQEETKEYLAQTIGKNYTIPTRCTFISMLSHKTGELKFKQGLEKHVCKRKGMINKDNQKHGIFPIFSIFCTMPGPREDMQQSQLLFYIYISPQSFLFIYLSNHPRALRLDIVSKWLESAA